MRFARTFLLTIGLCGLGMAAVAVRAANAPPTGNNATPWYAVEILVFRYTGPDAARGVTWPATVPAPSLRNAVYPAQGTNPNFLPLRTVSSAMTQARQKLAAAVGYDPVLLTGWEQPGFAPDAAVPVSLTPPAATQAGATAASAANPIGAEAAVPQVQGTATLAVVTNNPYVELDLRLCEPRPPGIVIQTPVADTHAPGATSATSPATTVQAASSATYAPPLPGIKRQCFALHESRQVTPGQLQYYDTAAFGALVLVYPVKKPPQTPPNLPVG